MDSKDYESIFLSASRKQKYKMGLPLNTASDLRVVIDCNTHALEKEYCEYTRKMLDGRKQIDEMVCLVSKMV